MSIPVGAVDEDFFEGAKCSTLFVLAEGINESDMILMPDDSTAIAGPLH